MRAEAAEGAGMTQEGTIISRDEARALGLKRFFTGKPCKRGHIAEHYVRGGACRECALANAREQWTTNKSKRVRALTKRGGRRAAQGQGRGAASGRPAESSVCRQSPAVQMSKTGRTAAARIPGPIVSLKGL